MHFINKLVWLVLANVPFEECTMLSTRIVKNRSMSLTHARVFVPNVTTSKP